MRNITLRMDDELLRKIRHIAVDNDMSLAAWVVSILARTVESDESRSISKGRALARLEKGYNLGGEAMSRDAVHER